MKNAVDGTGAHYYGVNRGAEVDPKALKSSPPSSRAGGGGGAGRIKLIIII